MSDLYDSTVKVTWDPDGSPLVLVDYGDPMWAPVNIAEAGQEVQVSRPVRSAGTVAWPRANESHALTWRLATITDGVADAFETRLGRAKQLPRGQADVLLEFESGGRFRLKNAAVRAWPSGQTSHITDETVEILGGDYVQDFGDYPGGDPLIYRTPNGNLYLQPEP